jgi:serine protease Do
MNNQSQPKRNRLRSTLLTGLLVVAGSAYMLNQAADSPGDKNPKLSLVVNNTPINREGTHITSFAPVVKRVAPSVVNVFTTSSPKQIDPRQMPLLNDPLFRRFFGENPGRGQPELRAPKQYGLGSGVLVSRDGYILTNHHVVENADEIKVALINGSEEQYTAKVIGTDPKTEVAVLKIEGEDFPFVELGDSENIEVGDLVLAVGNPFGVGQTVTMGMISALGRGRAGLNLDYQDFIQTDAAINPGNSGGALIDAEGRLIGLNTFIVSRSGGSEGIGFAIPINLARSVMEKLVKHGHVIRGYLGVWMQDITPALAKQFDLKDPQGVVVTDVVPRSPAEKAGFKPGDIITEYMGKPVRDGRHLKFQVGDTDPDVTVPVTIRRGSETKKLEVTLTELSGSETASAAQPSPRDTNETLKGVTVGDISSQVRRQLGLPRDLQGALVTDIDPDSASYEAGLREGDVILEINRKRVTDAEEAVDLSEQVEEETVLLRIWSRGGYRYVVVDERTAK